MRGSRLKLWKTKPILRFLMRDRSSSSRCADVHPVEQVVAASRHVEAPDDVHECRLARARRTHDRDEVAALDDERHASECEHLNATHRVALHDVDECDDGVGAVPTFRVEQAPSTTQERATSCQPPKPPPPPAPPPPKPARPPKPPRRSLWSRFRSNPWT